MVRSSASSPAAPDLFGRTILPGLTTAHDIVTAEEEAALAAEIDAAPLQPFSFRGWQGKRLTASYGWRYDFDSARFAPAAPLPAWLLPLREQAARFAGLAADDLPHALLIRYDPGAGIGWHRDRPVFDHVIGISLGAEAMMRFRRRSEKGFERRSLPLTPRAAYHLTGEARHDWEHSIVGVDRTRWSITFRSLKA